LLFRIEPSILSYRPHPHTLFVLVFLMDICPRRLSSVRITSPNNSANTANVFLLRPFFQIFMEFHKIPPLPFPLHLPPQAFIQLLIFSFFGRNRIPFTDWCAGPRFLALNEVMARRRLRVTFLPLRLLFPIYPSFTKKVDAFFFCTAESPLNR